MEFALMDGARVTEPKLTSWSLSTDLWRSLQLSITNSIHCDLRQASNHSNFYRENQWTQNFNVKNAPSGNFNSKDNRSPTINAATHLRCRKRSGPSFERGHDSTATETQPTLISVAPGPRLRNQERNFFLKSISTCWVLVKPTRGRFNGSPRSN